MFLGFVDGNVISGPNGPAMSGHKSLRFILEKTNIEDMSQHSIEDVVTFRASNADAKLKLVQWLEATYAVEISSSITLEFYPGRHLTSTSQNIQYRQNLLF